MSIKLATRLILTLSILGISFSIVLIACNFDTFVRVTAKNGVIDTSAGAKKPTQPNDPPPELAFNEHKREIIPLSSQFFIGSDCQSKIDTSLPPRVKKIDDFINFGDTPKNNIMFRTSEYNFRVPYGSVTIADPSQSVLRAVAEVPVYHDNSSDEKEVYFYHKDNIFILKSIACSLIIVMMAITAIGAYISRCVCQGFLKINVALREVSDSMDLSTRLHLPPNKEFGQTVEAINLLLLRIGLCLGVAHHSAQWVSVASGDIAERSALLLRRQEEQIELLQRINVEKKLATDRARTYSREVLQAIFYAEQLLSQNINIINNINLAISPLKSAGKISRDLNEISVDLKADGLEAYIISINTALQAAHSNKTDRLEIIASKTRGIAERISRSEQQINSLTAESGTRIEQCSNLLDETKCNIQTLTLSAKRVLDILNDVATIAAEECKSIDQLETPLHRLRHAARQHEVLAKHAAQDAYWVQEHALKLKDEVEIFRL